MVEFYQTVRDQVINQTPLGMEGGGVYLSPRLEAWVAACDLLRVPPERRTQLIAATRFLHEAVEDRERSGSVYRMELEDLVPVSLEDFCARAD